MSQPLHELAINGIDYSDLVQDANVVQSIQEAHAETRMHLTLRKHDDRLSKIDLRGEVKYKGGDAEGLHPQFSGLIVKAKEQDTKYVIECKDHSQVLSETNCPFIPGPGLLHQEIVYYLGLAILPDAVRPENFYITNTATLADRPDLFKKRRYVYIAPVPNCQLEQQSLEIAEALIYKSDDSASIDDEIIAQCVEGRKYDAWADSSTRARLYVQASGFLDALEKGSQQLALVLDYLSYAAGFSTPLVLSKGKKFYHKYERARALTEIRESPGAYVRDTLDVRRYWIQVSSLNSIADPLKLQPQDPIVDLYSSFQRLIGSHTSRLSEDDQSHLNALHALRQARTVSNAVDALDNLWRCMEFLVSNQYVEPLFDTDDQSTFIALCEEAVINRYQDEAVVRQKERIERLKTVLSQRLNDVPLRTRWKAFCHDYKVELEANDELFLWKTRKWRNNHQHGTKAAIRQDDIVRVATILEKAILAAVGK